jgi:hypothetical protein
MSRFFATAAAAGGNTAAGRQAALAARPIPQMAPLAFEQIIIAGGDEDVSAGDLFDWVSPLLAGIPGGRWMSCEIDVCDSGQVTASYRDGSSARMVSLTLDAISPAAMDVLGLLPDAVSVTVILLNDFSSQAVTLLDSVARWLSIHETDDSTLAPVLRLMGGFQTVLSHA